MIDGIQVLRWVVINGLQHTRAWKILGRYKKRTNERQILRKQLRHPWLVKRNWLWHYQKSVNGGSVTESRRPARVLLQHCFEVGNTACLGCAGLAALAPSDMAVCRGLFAVGVLTAYQRDNVILRTHKPSSRSCLRAVWSSSTGAHHVGLRGEGAVR
jgi:hypothetical protein